MNPKETGDGLLSNYALALCKSFEDRVIRSKLKNLIHLSGIFNNPKDDNAEFNLEEIVSFGPVASKFLTSLEKMTQVFISINEKTLHELMNFFCDPCFAKSIYEKIQTNNDDFIGIVLALCGLLEFTMMNYLPKIVDNNLDMTIMKGKLDSVEFKSLIGPELHELMVLMFGPVRTFNVRNLFWHAFISYSQSSIFNGDFLKFMFLLFLNISNKLTFSAYRMNYEGCAETTIELIESLQNTRLFGSVEYRSYSKHFNIPEDDMLLKYLVKIDEYFSSQSYSNHLLAIDLCLVAIVHMIRCTFVNCVGWHEELKSSENRLFLSMDFILMTDLQKVRDKELLIQDYHIFLHKLGSNNCNYLYDLLVHIDGPRLKDRIGHGELVLKDIEESNKVRKLDIIRRSLNYALIGLLSVYGNTKFDLPVYKSHLHPLGKFKIYLEKLQSHLQYYQSSYHDVDEFENEYVSDILDPIKVVEIAYSDELSWLWTVYVSSIDEKIQDLHWTLRPTSLLYRLNKVIDLLNGQMHENISINLDMLHNMDDFRQRKIATLNRFYNFLPYYMNFLHDFVLGCLRMWCDDWFSSSFISAVSNNDSTSECDNSYLHWLESHSTHESRGLISRKRKKYVSYLEQTCAKVLSKAQKSKWELATAILQDLPKHDFASMKV